MDENRRVIDLEALEALESEVPLDDLFHVLSDGVARRTLYYLSEERTASLDHLADVVTGVEAAATESIATPADRDRVRIRLYHSVLPKLDALGYVEFDSDDRTVARANPRPEVRALLDLGD